MEKTGHVDHQPPAKSTPIEFMRVLKDIAMRGAYDVSSGSMVSWIPDKKRRGSYFRISFQTETGKKLFPDMPEAEIESVEIDTKTGAWKVDAYRVKDALLSQMTLKGGSQRDPDECYDTEIPRKKDVTEDELQTLLQRLQG